MRLAKISRRSPSNYLAELVPAEHTATIMASYFINKEAIAAMKADGFDDFMDARELELLMEVISRLSD